MSEELALKKVMVILSSYNGAKFIKEQINSILNQKGVNVSLLVRDDGSVDETYEIIQEYERNNQNVQAFKGENLGFANSFFEAMKLAGSGYDYYALSDQDDVWENDKLSCAVEKLENTNGKYRLYASGLKVVDENLNFQYMHHFDKIRLNYGSALSRQRLAGCTMVFNMNLYDLCATFNMKKNNIGTMSHDGLIYYTCLLCGGDVIFDKEGKILYRRHRETVTENGKGIIKKARTVLNIFGKCRGLRYNQTVRLYETYHAEMSEDMRDFTTEILSYKKSIRNTYRLFVDRRINCGILIADIINHIAVLARCY